jgi:hydroxypyruvate reductase
VSVRDDLAAIFEAAVARASAAACLAGRLPHPPPGRVILLGAGKAGAAMVAFAEEFYLDGCGLAPERLAGIGVCRHGYGAPTRLVPIVEAGHPVPDQAGLDATARVLALTAGAGPDDLVLALLSGGGSANWVAPAEGLSLDDKRSLTRALQRAGADIGELNCVRKHLSRIKGGRLARVARPARLVTLAISDVPGDDPAVIASGPTVPDPTTLADARAVLARRLRETPPAVARLLADPASESPKPRDPAFAGAEYEIVCRPRDALAAAIARAEALGYRPVVLGPDVEGEARAVAAEHARLALRAQAEGGRVAILSGGELTVTVSGEGRGGPNQEYALALAVALAGAPGIAALAADTDGTDGGAGSADDPAGAVVDATTLRRASSLGLDPSASLCQNDATPFFAALGDLVSCGPTRTNVNDIRIILVEGS